MTVMLLNMLSMLKPFSKNMQTNRSFLIREMPLFSESSNFCRLPAIGDSYQIDKSITDVISNFPTPTNHTDLWSFFGLFNQLSASNNMVSLLLTTFDLSSAQRTASCGHQLTTKHLTQQKTPNNCIYFVIL